jgi:uncharacterized protein YgiB involved in biofilm formation
MKRTPSIPLARMRKQTRGYSLVPLTAAIATIVTGCSSDHAIPGYIFKDALDCTRTLPHLATECESAYANSKREAAAYGPRYRNIEDCEYEFGDDNCVTENNSYYLFSSHAGRKGTGVLQHARPRMDAFVARPFSSQSRVLVSEPLLNYSRSGKKGFYTVDGRSLNTQSTGRIPDASGFGQRTMSVRSHTLSRGGFGYTVAAMSKATSGWSSSSRSGGGWSWGG